MRAFRKFFKPETGRQACVSQLRKALGAAKPAGKHVGILILKPIQLQDVYASLGVRAGVDVMSAVQATAASALAGDDSILQLDDGKLAIILGALSHPNHALLAANKVRTVCEKSLDLGGRELALRLRIGIAIFGQAEELPEYLLQRAELALRQADETDQPIVTGDQPEIDPVLRDWEIEKGLNNALSNGDIELHFQPKIDIRTRTLCGAEGLLRWDRARLSPDSYISVAEKTGQVVELTRFALQAAVRQLAEWPLFLGGIGVAVNLSAIDLQRRDLPALIKSVIEVWNVAPARLTVEVTETALMEDLTAAHDLLQAIRELGCRVAIDDFGTGYSSLEYFKTLPADEVKIDKSFVLSMLTDNADRNIVHHVIGLAQSFGLQVVAEGVENQETLECLAEMNCDYAQGFHFAKAMPASEFTRWALQQYRTVA